jgi:NTE family protein
MQVLFEAGLRPSAVVGCSVGALNAAFVAGHPHAQRAEELAERWLRLRRADVVAGSRVFMLRSVLRGQCAVLSNEPLRRLIDAWLPAATFEQLAVPLRVVTTSLAEGCAVYHERGELAPVLLASAALPGLFEPVPLPGPGPGLDLHVDGGITDLVPVAAARDLTPTHVWAIDVAAGPGLGAWRPRNALDVLLASLRTSMRARPLPDLPGVRVHVVRVPCVAGGSPLMDFSETRALLRQGRLAAQTCLAACDPQAVGLAA